MQMQTVDAGHRPARKHNAFARAARQVDAARKVTKKAPVKPPTETVSPREAVEALRLAASKALDIYMIERVVNAEDSADLLDRLDSILDDEKYTQLWAEFVNLLGEPILEVVQGEEVPAPNFLHTLIAERPDLAAVVERGNKLSRAGLAACLQFNAWVAAEREKRGEAPVTRTSPMRVCEWVSDPGLPLAIRKAWLAKDLSDVAYDSLIAFHGSSKTPPPWMLEALLATWVDGAQQWLNYLVGMPGVDSSTLADSTKVVTRDDAFSLARTAEAGYQTRLSEARKVEGWYPVPELEDGD
jgi:hypothetical protein